MKKWILLVSGIIVTAMVIVYIAIPDTIKVEKTAVLNGNQHGVYRAMVNKNKWGEWFPANAQPAQGNTSNEFAFNHSNYQPAQQFFDGIEVLIKTEAQLINSMLRVVPVQKDSSAITWTLEINSGANPFKRLNAYLTAGALRKDMGTILKSAKSYLEKQEHVYDMVIKQQKVTDTFLLTLKSVLPVYPEPAVIYRMIDTIYRHMQKEKVTATNFPMMHVQQVHNQQYETMVAVPINRKLPDRPPIIFKRMVAGNILVTEVKGGRKQINDAFRRVENYMEDYRKLSPALPFESLVTNRIAVPDTSAWITRIYYPVYE